MENADSVAIIILLSVYLLENMKYNSRNNFIICCCMNIISFVMTDVEQYRSMQQLNRVLQRRRTKRHPEDVMQIFEQKKKEVAEMVKESQLRHCDDSEKVEVPEKKMKLSVTFNPDPQKKTIKCDSSKWDILYNWPH
ncbi:hypothetical protein T4D_3437 [Trichinella pseudospiralis]|uniref:Uncharacterized protein n=1 Tax=Trichinella pseudospiralis TaxID=6337 RepID=A0A0V1FGD1_TRIPS|nr:hypothetical protein T4D_3437 [Trichinella pseudospiralis]